VAGVISCGPAFASNADPLAELKRMSVEELLNVEVTSVSRREEGIRNAAAAIAVLTREDLRRSGATSMPEALRMVPGLHVARRNSSSWAVSARGFSAVTSEKLLVQSDTRSIYTPLFSGVSWDVQNYLLTDIERVEVIRGPGAALWGSNAVNGVINIITRSARDTHGSHAELAVGSFERFDVGGRYGGETAGGKHFRVFGRYFDRAATQNTVVGTDDSWNMGHVGFRADWDEGATSSWTLQGDAYSGAIGQLEPAVLVLGRPGPEGRLGVDVSGGNVLGRWRHQTTGGSDVQLRAYYDVTQRDDPSFEDTLQTFDIDLQQRLNPVHGHEIVWGGAFRLTSNRNRSGGIFALSPEDSEDQLWSGFIQDQMALSDALTLTVGTKVEHNDFSGVEWQPSVRLSWIASRTHSLWAAVSRAVRVPTRLERDVAIDASDPAGNPVVRLLGNPDFGSERLNAFEAGYRWQPREDLAFDLAAYYNDYDRLASLELGTPFIDATTGQTVIPVLNENLTAGRARGVELLAEWTPVDAWRLSASYSHVDLELASAGLDANRGVWLDGSTPRSQFGLRSLLTLGRRFDFDAQFRHHTRIRRIPLEVSGAGIAGYSELDLRLGWLATPQWTFSLVGQNLLHAEHPEFGRIETRGELERAAYLKAEWRR
jgi:iron complex outermembrane receptor protein